MINSKKHKVIINRKKLDVISADTDFYEFVGDSRFYFTFNRLIQEEDKNKFIDNVNNRYQDWFVIHMVALDGATIPCYVKLQEVSSKENLEVVLLDIDRLRTSEWMLDKRCRVNEAIHGLYGDDAFVYYPETDEVEIISGTGAHTSSHKMSLAQLQNNLEQVAEDANSVKEFIGALRSGSRYVFIKVNGGVRNTKSDAGHSIIKCAGLYENGTYTMAVGYIHEYMERTYNDTRKVEIDSLTGLLSKGEVTNMVIRTVDMEKRENVSLAIVDIDHFKQVNDTFGHMTGDNIIRQVAAIMADEVGDQGFVGRIGGDEFMILFYDAFDLENARGRLRSIKNTVSGKFPPGVAGQPAITLSIGCAGYPKDAANYEELFTLADFALYRAKEKGRNRYIIYDKELHGDISKVKQTTQAKTRINNRGDMSRGEIMCVIMDKAFSQEEYPIDRLLDDYVENFEVQRITIFDAAAGKVLHMAGAKVPSKEVIAETERYIRSEYWQKCYENNETIINDVVTIEEEDEVVYRMMKKQGVLSCIHIKFQGMGGMSYVLALESVTKRITWNEEHLHYFRLMAKVLSECKLS